MTTAAYQPTARRPIADAFRWTAKLAVRACVRLEIHPDAVSYASVVAAAGAAACLAFAADLPALLLIGPCLCFVRLWMNMLDGMVALAAGVASRRGEILNELPDRVSDALIFAGAAEGGLCHKSLGYVAAVAAVLTAYVGTLSQAVGARRQFGGWMSKPWRMVWLAAGSWGAWAWHAAAGREGPTGWGTPLDWACGVVVAGCVQTIAVRLRRTLAELRQQQP